MRKILCFIFLLIAPAIALAQTPTVQHLAWDYVDADLASGAVDHFQLCYDTTNCASVLVTDPGLVKVSTAGTTTYTYQIAALTQGSHTVWVNACNSTTCSDNSNVVTFSVVVKPNAPKNVVIK